MLHFLSVPAYGSLSAAFGGCSPAPACRFCVPARVGLSPVVSLPFSGVVPPARPPPKAPPGLCPRCGGCARVKCFPVRGCPFPDTRLRRGIRKTARRAVLPPEPLVDFIAGLRRLEIWYGHLPHVASPFRVPAGVRPLLRLAKRRLRRLLAARPLRRVCPRRVLSCRVHVPALVSSAPGEKRY